jgi:acetyltransferase-like isoleucine patch superfamily enzyme
MMAAGRILEGDWHPGSIPPSVAIDETAYLESSYSFLLYRSECPVGARLGRGAAVYQGTMFDVGPHGRVTVGDYVLLNAVRIVCDAEVVVDDYAVVSWNVLLMDTYRVPSDPAARRAAIRRATSAIPRRLDGEAPARPVRIGRNAWIGFDACILPGVTIGEGAIVGARSVVVEDVKPFTIVAGNPARLVRVITAEETADVG